jgi:hypothetical protein
LTNSSGDNKTPRATSQRRSATKTAAAKDFSDRAADSGSCACPFKTQTFCIATQSVVFSKVKIAGHNTAERRADTDPVLDIHVTWDRFGYIVLGQAEPRH